MQTGTKRVWAPPCESSENSTKRARASLCRPSENVIVGGGIFQEEPGQHLLLVCELGVLTCLSKVHKACVEKNMNPEVFSKVFSQCVCTILNDWTDEDFLSETTALEEACKARELDLHTILRRSFVAYARSIAEADKVKLRVTVPTTQAFYKCFLKECAHSPDISNGKYFKPDTQKLDQKCVLIDVIRFVFAAMSKHYVMEEAQQCVETDERHEEKEKEPDVDPLDSASNVGSSKTDPSRRAKSTVKSVTLTSSPSPDESD